MISLVLVLFCLYPHLFLIIQYVIPSNPKQPSYKKCATLKNAREKRCEIQSGSQEMAVMVGLQPVWQKF